MNKFYSPKIFSKLMKNKLRCYIYKNRIILQKIFISKVKKNERFYFFEAILKRAREYIFNLQIIYEKNNIQRLQKIEN